MSGESLLRLYACAAVLGAIFTLQVIGAREARKHPLAAALTAAVCGLLWPVLLVYQPWGDRRD